MKQKEFRAWVSLVVLIAVFASLPCAVQAQSSYHIKQTIHIPGDDWWDYLAVDPGSQNLFVSHGTVVNVVNRITGDSVSMIPNTTGVHGIAFIDAMGRGYISNGRLNNVYAFDLKTFKVLATIETGENPDAIFYEPFSKMIITCNGRSHNISVIDPQSNKVVATTDVGGKPEAPASDGKGMFYINIEDKSQIVAVSAKDFSVQHTWSLAPGEGPTGLAFDTETHRLFSGCDGQLIVMDATDGHIVAKIPIGDGCDGVAFDPSQKRVFTSNGEGTLTIIHENSADDFAVEANVPTQRGARTIALDLATHEIYEPTAEFGETPKPTADNPHPRPTMIPGSFKVLVLGNN